MNECRRCERNKNLYLADFERANIDMILRKVQMRWGRLIIYERRLLFMIERTDQSLYPRSKLLIFIWIRNELKELNVVSVSIHDIVDLPVLKRRKSKRMIRSYNSASCGDQLLLLCFVFYE